MNNRLLLGLLAAALGFAISYVVVVNSQQLETALQRTTSMPTSSTLAVASTAATCSGKVTPSLTEGPYYKAGSPAKTNLVDATMPSTNLLLSGYVFNTNCRPIANAWLDFWQADSRGNYDNQGYTLRGHQLTDENGRYTLQTLVPGEYPGRTVHIHVKVRASEQSPTITTQLFIPGVLHNQSDAIFDQALLMQVSDTTLGKQATYNFVVPTP